MNLLYRDKAALVVDDDPLVTNLARSALTALGVGRVRTANCGEDALALLSHPDQEFALIVSDLSMPGMDGVEFLRHLAERRYAGHIIVMSGHDERVLDSVVNLANTHRLRVIGALQKPFSIPALAEMLERIVDARPESPIDSNAAVTPAELAAAISTGKLIAHYQPKLEIATGKIRGVEALARWEHPEKGRISPAVFIPMAEQYFLMGALTETIMLGVLQQCRAWQNQGVQLQVAINVPADALADLDLPDWLAAEAARVGVSPAKLMIEVTETQLLSDARRSLDTLNRLRLKGVGLSIDDFGTGYSSLSQLQQVPFQELKVDKDFVQRADRDVVSRAIIESSVQLARRLNMRVVAEGVETARHLALAAELGCDEVQGFFIARPMAGDDLLAWLRNRSAATPDGSEIACQM
jgi:EAL domain-containing protein (putative c-di-GMP-specific phosphodiesterase class I)/CheY-like chemotaxis protein